jgi:hypothetical protein
MRHASVLVAAAALLLAASAAAAQDRRELTLDVRPFSADIGMAWPIGAGHLWGFSVGGGPDEFNRTFVPEVTDTSSYYVTLEQIVRLGPFYRYESGGRYSIDLGLRVALGGVRGVSGSPDLVAGLHAGAFYGGRRFRVGPRLFIGRSTEPDVTNIVHVEWLTARLRVPF